MPHVATKGINSNLPPKATAICQDLDNTSLMIQQNIKSSMYPSPTQRRRASLKELYSMKGGHRSSPQLSRGNGSAATIRNPARAAKIKRWDGKRRTTTVWDSLRHDPELWDPDGDCLVHLYEAGQSKRGASLRLSLSDIKASKSRPFLRLYRPLLVQDLSLTADQAASTDGESLHTDSSPAKYEIHVPAPSHLSREDALRYHLTTRNFFAWMFQLPTVGSRLGEALIALLDRMNQWRTDKQQNREEILAYLDNQEYTDFRQCPDHSLAILQLAERYEFRDLWTDAFVHCVGMNENLIISGEFESTSSASKAMIMRSSLEMNVRLERAGRSLGDFLEEDLSRAYLGVGNDARVHLERFRSFLHSFYVGKFGYWPPSPTRGQSVALPLTVYRSMYFEFRKLYEYLVDPQSSDSMQDNRPTDGGLCILQNVVAFDRRHGYVSLPHPLPLVPEVLESMSKQKSPRRLKFFGNKQAKYDRRLEACNALSAATNSSNLPVTEFECPLVREYLYFEKVWTMEGSETVTYAEARKVRWILIYAILQTLISVTQAPKEVRDTKGVTYPLCCQIAGTPWKTGWKTPITKEKSIQQPENHSKESSPSKKSIEIKPDVDYSQSFSTPPIPLDSSPLSQPPSLPNKSSARKDSKPNTPTRKHPDPIKTKPAEMVLLAQTRKTTALSSHPPQPDEMPPLPITPTSTYSKTPSCHTIPPALPRQPNNGTPSPPITGPPASDPGWERSSTDSSTHSAASDNDNDNEGDDEEEESDGMEHMSVTGSISDPEEKGAKGGLLFGFHPNPKAVRVLGMM